MKKCKTIFVFFLYQCGKCYTWQVLLHGHTGTSHGARLIIRYDHMAGKKHLTFEAEIQFGSNSFLDAFLD